LVSLPEAFWDSSALVPTCVHQSASPDADGLLRAFAPVVWWAAYVELRSAISRLLRGREIGSSQANKARAFLNQLNSSWKVILPSDTLRDSACSLLDLYPLRAADALQLAAALTWCDNRPAGRTFLCGDKRLADAAESVGFSLVLL
jgi:predicted nucleic acid-binding protein